MKIEELMKIMSMLRDPEHGCPWDLKQDFQSIAPHTLEEVYEVLDAIDREDYQHLKNELGDLLFQVVFYAQLGRESGYFDFDDIVREIGSKLLHRHPHVFPGGTAESFGRVSDLNADQVESSWEKIKTRERDRKSAGTLTENQEGVAESSILDDIPGVFPALLRAKKIQKRAASVGFDWQETSPVLNKLREEILELECAIADSDNAAIQDELGDVLFSIVNLARHLRQDSETCLRAANKKFEKRFRKLELLVSQDGKQMQDMCVEELEGYWVRVKAMTSGHTGD